MAGLVFCLSRLILTKYAKGIYSWNWINSCWLPLLISVSLLPFMRQVRGMVKLKFTGSILNAPCFIFLGIYAPFQIWAARHLLLKAESNHREFLDEFSWLDVEMAVNSISVPSCEYLLNNGVVRFTSVICHAPINILISPLVDFIFYCHHLMMNFISLLFALLKLTTELSFIGDRSICYR